MNCKFMFNPLAKMQKSVTKSFSFQFFTYICTVKLKPETGHFLLSAYSTEFKIETKEVIEIKR